MAADEVEPVEVGVDSALARVFVVHGPAQVGLARLLRDDPGQAEEVVQEAFVRQMELEHVPIQRLLPAIDRR